MELVTPLHKVLNTTKAHLDALEECALRTVGDLLFYFPRSHEDLSAMQTLAGAPLNEKTTLAGTVDHIKLVRTRSGKQLVTARFTDTEGSTAEVIWFNQPHIKRMLSDGADIVLTGKLVEDRYKLQIQSPLFEKSGESPLIHSGRLVPLYPQHGILTGKWLREKMLLVREAIDLIPETLPDSLRSEENLPARRDMVRALHFPSSQEEVERAKLRLAFERLYDLQLDALKRKREWQGERQERLRTPMDVDLIKSFFASLKFTPTDSQRIAIYEILKDMEKDQPMSRLLEGDVGSGKTLVATAVAANVIRHGGQCALMVPTEVLAKQHGENIARSLINFHSYQQKHGNPFRHPTVALLTGSVPKSDAMTIKQKLLDGTIDLIIGTHALIEENVVFRDLRLVVVDEQHRFGVRQRELLKEKGNPHFLSMTATPIPRTLALTAYGHHDLSVLTEKPGNRRMIQTKVVSPMDRRTVELFIDQKIEDGRQVFVICPLIRSSENEELADVRSVQAEAERLRHSFPRRSITMLHGQMTSDEKADAMRRFKDRESDVLVSTSVIEVGIDVPNACVMVIEGAERFGLAQLHQFRGRVGRGEHQSHCFLFTSTQNQAHSARLKAMEEHDSGFVLAEIDLRLRGPGDLLGLRQSGFPEGTLLSLLQPELIHRARRAAEKMMQ